MKTYQKPFFWGLVLLFFFLIFCVIFLLIYLYFGQFFFPDITMQQPNYSNFSTPFNSTQITINKNATIVAVDYEREQYVNDGNVDKTIELTNKLISLDPDNPKQFREAVVIYRDLANNFTSESDYVALLEEALKLADRGIYLFPKFGDLYLQRAFVYYSLNNSLPYRVDREKGYAIAIENLKAVAYLRSKYSNNPEHYLVIFNSEFNHCDEALSDAIRFSTAEPSGDVFSDYSTERLLESAYACKGVYQKAFDFNNIDIEKTGCKDSTCRNQINKAIYLIHLGRSDEAYEIVNQSIEQKPNYTGIRYFIRSVIEFDRGEYDKAIEDAYHAEGSSWAHGMYINYILGLNSSRLGNKEEAIEYLQYAEATLYHQMEFAIIRSREELDKLGSKSLVIEPSEFLSVTPMPVYPTLDVNNLPTHTPTPLGVINND